MQGKGENVLTSVDKIYSMRQDGNLETQSERMKF